MPLCEWSNGNCARARWSVWVMVVIFAGMVGPATSAAAQANANWPKARAGDVRSVNSILLATYESISSTGSHGRDLKRFQSLLAPDARLIDVTYRNGKPAMVVRTVEQFVEAVSKSPAEPRRYEREIARRTETYGNLVQVWSTNVYGIDGKPKPAGHGINSITLTWDGTRWWIIAVTWKNQTPGQMVPAEYLSRQKKPLAR